MNDQPMGRLHVDIHTGASGSDPVILPVEIIGANHEVAATLGVPEWVGAYVDLAPGEYQVRGLLPSGSYIQQRVDVPAGGVESVSLRSRSPREWLAASVLAGDVPEAGRYERELARSRGRSDDWVRFWRRGAESWEPCPWPAGGWLYSDGIFWGIDLPALPDPDLHAVQVGGGDAHWRCLVVPPTTTTHLRLRPGGGAVSFERGLHLSFSIGHSGVDSVVQFLAAGLQASAQAATDTLLEQAEAMLWGKRSDPLAAAAGGYLLLRSSALDRLHSWPANFAEWSAWLPDASVIRGMQLLRETGPSDEAAHLMARASETGPPVFAEGLAMLDEGTAWLEAELEPSTTTVDLASMRRRVRAWVTAADTTQPFTTVFGSAPDHPSLASSVGVPENMQHLHFLPSFIPPEGLHTEFPLPPQSSEGVRAASLVQVLPTPDGWLVDGVERPYEARAFRTKAEAIEAARGGMVGDGRLVVRRRDGSTQDVLGLGATRFSRGG